MSTNKNVFEYATRHKLRFTSARGELSTEQLWDVPLRSSDKFSLDDIAKTANKALKEATEESFVATTRTAAHVRLEMTLEVVKSVIEARLADEEAAKRRAAAKEEHEKLIRILAEKQDEKLTGLSEATIKKRIAELEREGA